jgi:hypothetical protein
MHRNCRALSTLIESHSCMHWRYLHTARRSTSVPSRRKLKWFLKWFVSFSAQISRISTSYFRLGRNSWNGPRWQTLACLFSGPTVGRMRRRGRHWLSGREWMEQIRQSRELAGGWYHSVGRQAKLLSILSMFPKAQAPSLRAHHFAVLPQLSPFSRPASAAILCASLGPDLMVRPISAPITLQETLQLCTDKCGK